MSNGEYKINYGPQGTTLIQVGTQFYLAYQDGETIFYWSIEQEDIKNITEATNIAFDELGILKTPIEGFQHYTTTQWEGLILDGKVWNAGDILEIQDNKFSIESTMDKIRQAKVDYPFIDDPEYTGLVTELIIEDKENWVKNLELDTDGRFEKILTKHNWDKAMFTRARTYARDELGKNKLIEDGINSIKASLIADKANLDEDTIEWLANKWASAAWSDDKLSDQIIAATQMHSIYEIDKEFADVLANGVIDYSNKGEQEVKTLIETWLPPQLRQPYLDNLTSYAGMYLNDPNFENDFIEKMKDERFSFYPSWDREIPMSNILSNAMTMVETFWGVKPGETDAIVNQLISINDTSKWEEIIRKEGIKQGNPQMVEQLFGAMDQTWGDGTVRSQEYEMNPGG